MSMRRRIHVTKSSMEKLNKLEKRQIYWEVKEKWNIMIIIRKGENIFGNLRFY